MFKKRETMCSQTKHTHTHTHTASKLCVKDQGRGREVVWVLGWETSGELRGKDRDTYPFQWAPA